MVNKRFIQGDCIKVLKCSYRETFDLVLTDSPYNIGWKYSNKVKDNKEDYHEWCLGWAELCISRLKSTGVLAIINYPENNNILYTNLIRKGYNFVQQLIWEYPTNVGQSNRKYTRNYRTIIIFSKSGIYCFNPKKQEYRNPTDKRIKERIEKGFAPNHYATFEYNLCKNVSKDKKNNGINQLPRELVEMLIETYTNEGDYVLDPFVGNGTVMDIANELCRNSIGIDINSYKTVEVKKEEVCKNCGLLRSEHYGRSYNPCKKLEMRVGSKRCIKCRGKKKGGSLSKLKKEKIKLNIITMEEN